MTNFVDRLKQCRKKSGKTQKQVALAIGTTEQNYQRYERGAQQPTLPVLLALADVLEVSLDYLTGFEEVDIFDEMAPVDFEKYVVNLLRMMDYEVATPQAHEGVEFDAVIEKNKEYTAVQINKCDKILAMSIHRFYTLMTDKNIKSGLYITSGYFSDEAIVGAFELGIELWDRKKLLQEHLKYFPSNDLLFFTSSDCNVKDDNSTD